MKASLYVNYIVNLRHFAESAAFPLSSLQNLEALGFFFGKSTGPHFGRKIIWPAPGVKKNLAHILPQDHVDGNAHMYIVLIPTNHLIVSKCHI